MIPYWYLLLGCLATAIAMWLAFRGRLREERQMRRAAEVQAREGGFAIGRARVHAEAADALLRALPLPMSPPDLPPRGAGLDATALAADWTLTMPTEPAVPEPDPRWAETLEAARTLERETLDAIADDAYDIEPTPGDGEQGQDAGDPPAGGVSEPGSPAVDAATPRYDWSQAGPVNPSYGVAPGWSRWAWYRRRAARWVERPRVLWGQLRRGTAGRVGDARLTRWVADLRASRSYRAAHSPEATRSWPWSETVARRKAEIAGLAAKYEVAQRTGATWGQQLGLMREALQPTKRSIPPTRPYLGCTP